MADSPDSQERFLRGLIGSFRCDVCRRAFDRDQVRIAAKHDEIWILSVRCHRCRHRQVYYVPLKEERFDEPFSELNGYEEEYFDALPPIDSDTLLDVHVFLRDFDGDFKALFRL